MLVLLPVGEGSDSEHASATMWNTQVLGRASLVEQNFAPESGSFSLSLSLSRSLSLLLSALGPPGQAQSLRLPDHSVGLAQCQDPSTISARIQAERRRKRRRRPLRSAAVRCRLFPLTGGCVCVSLDSKLKVSGSFKFPQHGIHLPERALMLWEPNWDQSQ